MQSIEEEGGATPSDLPTEAVDAAWYRARYPDVAASGLDPADHYARHGRQEGRAPNAWAEAWRADRSAAVDPIWYLARYPDVAAAGVDPRVHYARHGVSDGRFPNAEAARAAEVDAPWYSARYPNALKTGLDPRLHYARYGHDAGAFPNAAAEERRRRFDAVDAAWYRARYPDVAAARVDPRDHFADHGHADGRSPNAQAEADDALAAEVDPAWYLARYPDVAASGADPRHHYVESGHAEGRFPSVAHEPPELWATRFDAAWYVARNPDLGAFQSDPVGHFRHIGILEGRAPNPREEDRAAWAGVFDEAWYRARNPDVEAMGYDPLDHFIERGIPDRRRPNGRNALPGREVEAAEITLLKSGALGPEVALFVAWSADGSIKPHVLHYVASIQRRGIDCVLVITTVRDVVAVPDELSAVASVVYRRTNDGYDFAAWAHVLRLRPDLLDAEILYLVNDSVFGPFSDDAFTRVVARIRDSEADIVGLTDSPERGWHIQSYFLAIKRRALSSRALRDFFDCVIAFEHKDDVVNEYETQFARLMIADGLRCEALFATPGTTNATLHQWRKLIDDGFPFVKVNTVRGLIKYTDLVGWREAASLRGYDTAPADRTLAQMAARTAMAPISTAARKFNHRQAARAELHAFFATKDTIDLPTHPEPTVSVLMVVYNEAELTLRALRSLVATIDLPAEFIIVDNASTDDTRHLLDRVRNATVLRNVEDLHFLRAANQAAVRARGRALLFLNNDIRLEPGAVDHGLETLDGADDIAVVGAKLILTDGTLQEAGSIIWSDGACLGYGRGQSPDAYPYNFRRDVDYCSGAYMMVRRDLFERLGRFDTVYAPAYYEETDLCMRVRAAGFRVVYDPRIVVNHYEFASVAYAGEAADLMARNFKTFSDRHRSALMRRHLPQTSPLHLARASDRRRRRILMVDNLVPLGSYGAGFPRTVRLLEALNRHGFFVTYYPTFQPHVDARELRAKCAIDVEFVLGGDRPSLTELVEERPGYYDAMFICRPNNMAVVRDHFMTNPLPYSGTSLIYDAEAVCAPREALRRAIHGDPMSPADADKALADEIGLSDVADLTLVVNHQDAAYFSGGGRGNVAILNHAIAVEPGRTSFAERRDFLFVGRLDDDHAPNVDALFWFIEQIMPKLDRMIGTAYRLVVAGPTGTGRLETIQDPRVVVLGRVEDLSAQYAAARVFIGPTRYAAGIPLKIVEAAAYGVPTVITPLLADQLGWTSGEAALIGGDPEVFAEQCRRLYTDEATWSAVRDQAIGRVRTEFDPVAFDEKLMRALNTISVF